MSKSSKDEAEKVKVERLVSCKPIARVQTTTQENHENQPTTQVLFRGKLEAVDLAVDAQAFEIDCGNESEPRIVRGKIGPIFGPYLKECLKKTVTIQAELADSGTVVKINYMKAHETENTPAPNFLKHLEEISQLKTGWYYGKGETFPVKFISEVSGLLRYLVLNNIPAPFVNGEPNGRINAEWTIGFWEISADFSSDGTIVLSAWNKKTDAFEETNILVGSDETGGRNYFREYLARKTSELRIIGL